MYNTTYIVAFQLSQISFFPALCVGLSLRRGHVLVSEEDLDASLTQCVSNVCLFCSETCRISSEQPEQAHGGYICETQ